jgi:hypothetical protein
MTWLSSRGGYTLSSSLHGGTVHFNSDWQPLARNAGDVPWRTALLASEQAISASSAMPQACSILGRNGDVRARDDQRPDVKLGVGLRDDQGVVLSFAVSM